MSRLCQNMPYVLIDARPTEWTTKMCPFIVYYFLKSLKMSHCPNSLFHGNPEVTIVPGIVNDFDFPLYPNSTSALSIEWFPNIENPLISVLLVEALSVKPSPKVGPLCYPRSPKMSKISIMIIVFLLWYFFYISMILKSNGHLNYVWITFVEHPISSFPLAETFSMKILLVFLS